MTPDDRDEIRTQCEVAIAADGYDPHTSNVLALLDALDMAEKERDEARTWVRRLTAAERLLTCAYCGHAYPPGSPTHGAEVLTEHARQCTKHPLRGAETARDAVLGERAT